MFLNFLKDIYETPAVFKELKQINNIDKEYPN